MVNVNLNQTQPSSSASSSASASASAMVMMSMTKNKTKTRSRFNIIIGIIFLLIICSIIFNSNNLPRISNIINTNMNTNSMSTSTSTSKFTSTYNNNINNNNNNNIDDKTNSGLDSGSGSQGSDTDLLGSQQLPNGLQCDVSGTYHYNNGRYHYYKNSSDFRNSQKQKHQAVLQSPVQLQDGGGKQSRQVQQSKVSGLVGLYGTMYCVTGTDAYILKGFLPVIQYLKNGLNIPNANIRAQQRELQLLSQSQKLSQQEQSQNQWALATDQHLCQNSKALQSILPFFDVIIILSPNEVVDNEDNNNDHRILKRNENKFGTGSREEYKDKEMLRQTRIYKVKGFEEGPYPITIFIDVDMIPCNSHFALTLINKTMTDQNNNYIDNAPNNDNNSHNEQYKLVPFDIALTSKDGGIDAGSFNSSGIDAGTRTRTINYNNNIQNINTNHFKAIPKKNRRHDIQQDYNLHNTACVILNMNSHKTKELLKRNKELFISSKNPKYIHDQPSLGKIMYTMMLESKLQATNSATTSASSVSNNNNNDVLKHIDMDDKLVCRSGTNNKRPVTCDYHKKDDKDKDNDNESDVKKRILRKKKNNNNNNKGKVVEDEETYCLLAHKIEM